MAASIGPNLRLTSNWGLGDPAWDAPMNRNLRLLDAVVNLAVRTAPLNAPPASPALGDRYIIGTAPTGAWAGLPNQIATFVAFADGTTGWEFYVPSDGWSARLVPLAAAQSIINYVFRNNAWTVGMASEPDVEIPFYRASLATPDELYIYVATRRLVFPGGLTGSHMRVGANPTLNAWNVNIIAIRNGVSTTEGQASFAADAANVGATFSTTQAGGFVLLPGERLRFLTNTAPSDRAGTTGLSGNVLAKNVNVQ